jgi:hypothetical protein
MSSFVSMFGACLRYCAGFELRGQLCPFGKTMKVVTC